MPIEQQVVLLFAATKGYLDKLSISEISNYQIDLFKNIDTSILETIKKEKVISDATNKKLAEFLSKKK